MGKEKLTFETARALVEERCSGFELLSYDGYMKKSLFRCKTCGAELNRYFNSFIKSSLCIECKKRKTAEERLGKKRAYKARKRAELRMARYGSPEPRGDGRFTRKDEGVIRDDFNERYPSWEYVGGYAGCDSFITIRCKECGAEYKRSYIPIRHQRKLAPCKHCEQEKRDQEEALKIITKNVMRIRRERAREETIKRANVEHVCPICGKSFIGNQRLVYCSPECRHKASNKYCSRRKDKRFLGYARIHWRDIYRKTGSMTCSLCGKECDVNDYTTLDDGTIVCGENYPSVDHIVPAKLGGTDTWDNVQIAHRGCNSKKWAYSDVVFFTDQASFNI